MNQLRTVARARAFAPTTIRAQSLIARRLASSSTRSATADQHIIEPRAGGGPNRSSQFSQERNAVKHHAAESSELWRKLSIYAVVPALILASLNAWNLWNDHWEHESHAPPLEERPEYAYQNIRTKNFPFGDGDKTLFWNDKVNHHKKDDE